MTSHGPASSASSSRTRSDGVLLFDTGFGFGNRGARARYRPRSRRVADVVVEHGLRPEAIDVVANCHLHADHAGQNARLPGIPVHVQPAELAVARAGDYTLLDWIDGPGVRYERVAGDHDIARGVGILATPGHSPGHQSLVVDQADGPLVLAGQAVYGPGEWSGKPGAREGRSSAWDQARYDASAARLRALDPARVLFGHDRRPWLR